MVVWVWVLTFSKVFPKKEGQNKNKNAVQLKWGLKAKMTFFCLELKKWKKIDEVHFSSTTAGEQLHAWARYSKHTFNHYVLKTLSAKEPIIVR